MEAFCGILVGIFIGFFYNWRMSMVSLACTPFMIMGSIMNAKFQAGLSKSSDALIKDANLLAGDAIINYRTVASFGNEEQILKDYERLLRGPMMMAIRKSNVIGFTFGFS